MTHKTSYAFHHNFPNLAEESGFTFNTHKPRIHIEWNKIKMVDIDSIIRDRKFGLLEQHINDILGCVLESEFDVRILDEGVLKIFRLSQLAVEYQQFCRNYLDRSIYVMRKEVTNLLKEVETTRRSLKEKDEEIRKLKRKSKHSLRTPLHYGNENIATMLLKTLNNTKGDIFSSTSHADVLQYNKCSYCEKIFLNQLYLKSHMSRRHADIINIPTNEAPEKITANENTNSKLNEEIEELKTKLKQMENLIINTRSSNNQIEVPENIIQNVEPHSKPKLTKEMKDAEVSTDVNMQDKIDTWKKEEYEKYNQEIVLLRKQIIDIISNKEKQEQSSIQNDLKIMEQLQATIKQQSTEIVSLKEELLKGGENEKEKRKEIENQMVYWVKQAEKQSNEYKVLLQKLNDVTTEAREYRARADAEKEKSSKLQDILDQHLNRTPKKESNQKNKINEEINETNDVDSAKITEKTPTADLITLSKLQQKAQELLNMNDTSTCESSCTSDEKIQIKNVVKNSSSNDKSQNQTMKRNISKKSTQYSNDIDTVRKSRNKPEKKLQNKINLIAHTTSKKENSYVHIPSSPMKIVRAKVTEEVNQRLISLGVDPLRNRLPKNTFRKQRIHLQKEQETKTKKFPVREKILHSIMAHLDESTANKNISPRNDYISPSKSSKTFSLSSVFTNVKTKALSLVKSSESINNTNKSYNHIAKKAIALLKTPPESANTSPIIQRHSVISPNKTGRKVSKSKRHIKNQSSKSLTQSKNSEAFDVNNVSDDSNSQSLEQEHTHKQKARVVNNLVKSPIRRPTDVPDNQNITDHRFFVNRDNKSQPKSDDIYQIKSQEINVNKKSIIENIDDSRYSSSDVVESIVSSPRKFYSEENINNFKQTKGVLKNASSTSSLNKKKVIFDMDAIQMKSMSASPSQSITEKSNNKEQLESGIVNLDTEEWDISSIENEHPTSTFKVQVTSHTSPKIAELKKSIESQLTRRNPTLSTALVGGVDVLTAPVQKMTNFGGSNTSLGSSILDDTDSIPVQNKTFVKSIHVEKDDSEIEISDLINDTVDNKTYVKSY